MPVFRNSAADSACALNKWVKSAYFRLKSAKKS